MNEKKKMNVEKARKTIEVFGHFLILAHDETVHTLEEEILMKLREAEGYLAALEGEEVKALRDEIKKLQLTNLCFDWVEADGRAKELLDLLATERDRFGKLETEMKKELAEERAAAEKLVRVLQEIADEDYRGNRSPSSGMAFRAVAAYRNRHKGEQSGEGDK